MTIDFNLRFLPRSLGELHAAKPEPPGGLHRLRRHPDHVGAVAKTLEWPWPNFDPRLLIVGRISLNETRLQAAQNDSCGLLEALARLAEFDTEGIELPFRETAAESDDYSPLGQMIQKNRLLSHAERIVPWKDEGAGHELNRLGARCDITQKNDVVRNHRVIEKVVLDRHQQVESHCLRLERQAELLSIDLDIRSSWVALEQWHQADLHRFLPFY